jgi:hypothetical protein
MAEARAKVTADLKKCITTGKNMRGKMGVKSMRLRKVLRCSHQLYTVLAYWKWCIHLVFEPCALGHASGSTWSNKILNLNIFRWALRPERSSGVFFYLYKAREIV